MINDCYNSNPVALAAMVELLRAHARYRRAHSGRGRNARTGAAPPNLHREAGRAAAQAGKLDWIIGVQGDAESFVQRRDRRRAIRRARANFLPSSAEAAKFLRNLMQPGICCW